MFEQLTGIFQVDWIVLQNAARAWLNGGNPYGALGPPHDFAGAFAYPPFALTWLALFVPLGAAGFWIWSLLELGAWWLLIRRERPAQIALLIWSPVVVHLLLGQSTLAFVLALWAAYRLPSNARHNWLRGFLLAFALTKPQTALLPMLWLLWHERSAPQRLSLWGGLALGLVLLALPPTLRHPGIWRDWMGALGGYRGHQQFLPIWQGYGLFLLLPVTYVWWRQWQTRKAKFDAGRKADWRENPWPWFLTIALFPQAAIYSAVTLLPALRPHSGYSVLGGLGLSSVLISPITAFTQPLFFAGHLLAGWIINGGTAKSEK